jgi:hypothetical protein
MNIGRSCLLMPSSLLVSAAPIFPVFVLDATWSCWRFDSTTHMCFRRQGGTKSPKRDRRQLEKEREEPTWSCYIEANFSEEMLISIDAS